MARSASVAPDEHGNPVGGIRSTYVDVPKGWLLASDVEAIKAEAAAVPVP